MNTKRIIIPTILIIGMVLLTIGPAAGAARTFTGLIYWSNGTQCMALDGTPGNTLDITNNRTLVTYNQSTGIAVDVTTVPGRYTLVLDDPNDISSGDGFDYYTVATDGSKVETNTTHSTYWTVPGVIGFDIHLDPPAAQPDLIVEDITPNPNASYVKGYFFANETNDISAKITNIDTGAAGPFTVEFDVSGDLYYATVSSGLGAGNNITVYVTDTVIRTNGTTVTIDVTADSADAVSESNESNNAASWSDLVWYNGYKGKRYTGGLDVGKRYTGGQEIDTYKVFCVNGGMNYSAGDSYYLSSSAQPDWTDYNVTWDGDPVVPPTATLVEARLYVAYTWDKGSVISDYTSMTFNGVHPYTVEEHYMDSKLYDPAASVYGMLVYNVTDDCVLNGRNTANLTNSYIGGDNVSMRGMVLLVVYDDGGDLKQIAVNEEFDMLCGSLSRYSTTPAEATAWAQFPNPDYCAAYPTTAARLITFAPGADGSGSAGEGELIFNGQVWNDAWRDNEVHQIGISDVDVTDYLESTNNEAGFQSNADWMEAAIGILEVTYANEALIAIDQPEFVDPQSQFTINITVNPLGNKVSAVQYDLYYNTSVVWAEWANPGTFLNGTWDTDVTVLSIDNTFNTTHGKISYAETTLGNNDGTLPSVTEKGILTTIHFSAIGVRNTSTGFNFSNVLMSDDEKRPVNYEATDCGVTIYDNKDPVAIGTSMYRFNNVASKFQCFAVLCPCLSHAGHDTWWGNNITYIRWDFGDGQYGTSEGVPLTDLCEIKMHEYTTWNWVGGNEPGDTDGSSYEPFEAYLTVRDDGVPQLSNTTNISVQVYIAGDTNGDGVVNIFDAACVGRHYLQTATGPTEDCGYYWDEPQKDEADLNNDGDVDTIDAMIVGTNWNHAAWPPYYIE